MTADFQATNRTWDFLNKNQELFFMFRSFIAGQDSAVSIGAGYRLHDKQVGIGVVEEPRIVSSPHLSDRI
jgi:hypothetical protein